MSKVTEFELKNIISSYFLWKNLNENLVDFGSRKVNFPEAISEGLICYALGFNWHNKKRSNLPGDAMTADGRLVEIKATSNYDSDLTSFSPNTSFDVLIFGRLDLFNDKLEVYDLNMNFSQFSRLSINSSQTVMDQQSEKRRPRLSLIKYIESQGIKPITTIFIKDLVAGLN